MQSWRSTRFYLLVRLCRRRVFFSSNLDSHFQIHDYTNLLNTQNEEEQEMRRRKKLAILAEMKPVWWLAVIQVYSVKKKFVILFRELWNLLRLRTNTTCWKQRQTAASTSKRDITLFFLLAHLWATRCGKATATVPKIVCWFYNKKKEWKRGLRFRISSVCICFCLRERKREGSWKWCGIVRHRLEFQLYSVFATLYQ